MRMLETRNFLIFFHPRNSAVGGNGLTKAYYRSLEVVG